jgi:hypothetical protein
MLRRKSDARPDDSGKRRWNNDRGDRPNVEDYTFTLMVTAVLGAAANAASALIEIGRSAGWWH